MQKGMLQLTGSTYQNNFQQDSQTKKGELGSAIEMLYDSDVMSDEGAQWISYNADEITYNVTCKARG